MGFKPSSSRHGAISRLAGCRTKKITVGLVEADPLVLLFETGEIQVHEFGTNAHVLWRVAKDGSHFLDALITCARFLASRGAGRIDFEDNEAARQTALGCASAAGGDACLDFYLMLLGAE